MSLVTTTAWNHAGKTLGIKHNLASRQLHMNKINRLLSENGKGDSSLGTKLTKLLAVNFAQVTSVSITRTSAFHFEKNVKSFLSNVQTQPIFLRQRTYHPLLSIGIIILTTIWIYKYWFTCHLKELLVKNKYKIAKAAQKENYESATK